METCQALNLDGSHGGGSDFRLAAYMMADFLPPAEAPDGLAPEKLGDFVLQAMRGFNEMSVKPENEWQVETTPHNGAGYVLAFPGLPAAKSTRRRLSPYPAVQQRTGKGPLLVSAETEILHSGRWGVFLRAYVDDNSSGNNNKSGIEAQLIGTISCPQDQTTSAIPLADGPEDHRVVSATNVPVIDGDFCLGIVDVTVDGRLSSMQAVEENGTVRQSADPAPGLPLAKAVKLRASLGGAADQIAADFFYVWPMFSLLHRQRFTIPLKGFNAIYYHPSVCPPPNAVCPPGLELICVGGPPAAEQQPQPCFEPAPVGAVGPVGSVGTVAASEASNASNNVETLRQEFVQRPDGEVVALAAGAVPPAGLARTTVETTRGPMFSSTTTTTTANGDAAAAAFYANAQPFGFPMMLPPGSSVATAMQPPMLMGPPAMPATQFFIPGAPLPTTTLMPTTRLVAGGGLTTTGIVPTLRTAMAIPTTAYPSARVSSSSRVAYSSSSNTHMTRHMAASSSTTTKMTSSSSRVTGGGGMFFGGAGNLFR